MEKTTSAVHEETPFPVPASCASYAILLFGCARGCPDRIHLSAGQVEGTSMMPGLTDQDRIFINKYEYKIGVGQIQRADLVVFHFPLDPSQSYIKRVIGLPGDEVEIVDGDVYVNGQMQEEAYVPAEYRDHISLRRQTVPGNRYFVLGDHRSSSNDSRTWGFVDRDLIYGKAVFVYWPPEKIGRVH